MQENKRIESVERGGNPVHDLVSHQRMKWRRNYWKRKYNDSCSDPSNLQECTDCKAGEIDGRGCIRNIYLNCWLSNRGG